METLTRQSCLPGWLDGIPGYDPRRDSAGFTFDSDRARDAVKFFSVYLHHTKGRTFAGKPFTLEPWQTSIIANTFGWVDDLGLRRYREVFIYIPRKNGKTTLAAGIVLLLLTVDGEAGAEIVSAAGDRTQARIVFEQAVGMVRGSPLLSSMCIPRQHTIRVFEDGSEYKAISAEASTKFGLNLHGCIVDELHTQPDRELVDALTSSMGSREQPLTVYLTTADVMGPSICNEKYEYAVRVRDGTVGMPDPRFLPVIYEAESGDDWGDPEVWRKANPNLGVSVSEAFLRDEHRKARMLPSYEGTFRRMYLNQRTEASTRFIGSADWAACAGVDSQPLSFDEYRDYLGDRTGIRCWAGLDLSSKRDVTALVILWEDGYVLPYFWLPARAAEVRQERDRIPYASWAKAGFMELLDLPVIDDAAIVERIVAIQAEYNVTDVGFDRWGSETIVLRLGEADVQMVKFGQGFASMSAPTKELEAMVMARSLRHGNHPVLNWMSANLEVETDGSANMKPSKKTSKEKIDGIVALIMAIGRRMATAADQTDWAIIG